MRAFQLNFELDILSEKKIKMIVAEISCGKINCSKLILIIFWCFFHQIAPKILIREISFEDILHKLFFLTAQTHKL